MEKTQHARHRPIDVAWRADERLKLLGQPQLLIIDAIGYIPIDSNSQSQFEPQPAP